MAGVETFQTVGAQTQYAQSRQYAVRLEIIKRIVVCIGQQARKLAKTVSCWVKRHMRKWNYMGWNSSGVCHKEEIVWSRGERSGVGERSHHRFIRSASGFMGTRALTKIQDDQRRQKGESGYLLNLVLARIKHLESWPAEGRVKEWNKATPKPGVRVTVWVTWM
jgi:hypothetical protein